MKPCKLTIAINDDVYEYNIEAREHLEDIRHSPWVNNLDCLREDSFYYYKPIISDKLVMTYGLDRYPSWGDNRNELELSFDLNLTSDDKIRIEFICENEVITSDILHSDVFYIMSKHDTSCIWLMKDGNMHPYFCESYELDTNINKDISVKYRRVFADDKGNILKTGSIHIIVKQDSEYD